MTLTKVETSGNTSKQAVMMQIYIVSNVILVLSIAVMWVALFQENIFFAATAVAFSAIGAFLHVNVLKKIDRTWTTQTTNHSSQ